MEKLISMTNFVLQERTKWEKDLHPYSTSSVEFIMQTTNYANFLKQPLTIGMFVPCDRDGEPYDLSEVESWKNNDDYSRHYREELAFFNDAKEKVLFKGFEYIKIEVGFVLDHKDITIYSLEGLKVEWLLNKSKKIYLTESALKEIGINQ